MSYLNDWWRVFFGGMEYPYTDSCRYNDDWLLNVVKKLVEEFANFVNLNTIKYADPILWDIRRSYEANTVVVDGRTGNAYISVRAVPAGVQINRTEYWTQIYNYADIVDTVREQIATNEGDTTVASQPFAVGDLIFVSGLLYKVIAPMIAGDQFVVDSNIKKTTIERELIRISIAIENETTSREQADSDLSDAIDDEITARENAIADVRKDIIEVVNVAEHGLDSSGATDCAATFNQLIADAEEGTTFYFPHGVYWFTEPIVVNKWLNIIGDGTSTVLTFSGDGIVINHDKCNIENMKLIPLTSNKTGLYCEGDFCRIDNVFFTDKYNDASQYWGIALHLYDPWYTTVANVQINDYKASNFRNGTGIKLSGCVNVILENIYIGFKNIGINCDDTLVNGHACDGVQIEGGNIVTCNTGVSISKGSNYFFNNLLLDQIYNYCYNLRDMGYLYVNDSYVAILSATGTTVTGNERIITATGCTYLEFNNCSLRGRNELQVGIAFYDCSNVKINGGDIMALTDALVFNTTHYNYKLSLIGINFDNVTGRTFNLSKCDLICTGNHNVSSDSLYGSNVIPAQRVAKLTHSVNISDVATNYYTFDVPVSCGWTPTRAIVPDVNINVLHNIKVIAVNAANVRLQLYTTDAIGTLGDVTFNIILIE